MLTQLSTEPEPVDLASPHVRLRRYLRFLGADREVAADVAQESLLAALGRWPDGSAPLAWLLATARNLFRRQLRASGRRREIVDADRLHEMWQRHVVDTGEAERLALRECLEALPPRSREALQLRYGESLPREQIAARLGLGVEGVKSLLTRLRAALSECVRRRL
ncbi:MAG: RNA polymerase sigma factor [Planctomycetes bacterium]|nr:RNA polymerase sigma factor [Planctomycetota bacterium]